MNLMHTRCARLLTIVCFNLLSFQGARAGGEMDLNGFLSSAKIERPPVPLPPAAWALAEYAAVELYVTADTNGTIKKAIIVKPSKAKVYDEYTRAWVEKHWTMPRANVGDPELRAFTVPISLPRAQRPLQGKYPDPPYPTWMLQDGREALVSVQLEIKPDGAVRDAKVLYSSDSGFNTHTCKWVCKYWKFPRSEETNRTIFWTCAYVSR